MTTTATRERPIIFSGPMVCAILEGKKTQTRRVVNPQPEVMYEYSKETPTEMWVGDNRPVYQSSYARHYSPWQVGDCLWVRETFGITSFGAGVAQIVYAADGKRGNNAGVSDHKLPNRLGVVSSMRMPRHCSRLTLEVVDVRVERLQSITEEDAIAEGLDPITLGTGTTFSARENFEAHWDYLNRKRGYGWYLNPWVWVITFRRVEAR